MIKQRFTGFMIAVFMASLPAMVNAQFGNEVKLLASDGVRSDYFGYSVSIDGDTAIIGAYTKDNSSGDNSGAAYAFVRDTAGAWTEQHEFWSSDGAIGDRFGYSVSISGDTAIVGADQDDDRGSNTGAAYVFVRDAAGVWTERQKILASDGAAGDHFGLSVSISGDTAIVGAYMHDGNVGSSGAAYVFVRDAAGVWTEQDKLLASDGAIGDRFGYSVSISGDTAIVGAYLKDSNTGAAYVFVRDAAGVWTEQDKLLASDGAFSNRLGFSVSISGDTAIVGAYLNGDNTGAAYVFVRAAAGVWTEQDKLLASDGVAEDRFGYSVSISGDTAIVGADLKGSNNTGAAYVFVRAAAGVWTEQDKLLASDGANGDVFGQSVSIGGNMVIVGARFHSDGGLGYGAAYVYTSAGTPAPDITVTDPVAPINDQQIPFGDVTEMASADKTVTVANDGNASLVLGKVAEANALAVPFSILDDTCSAQTLTPATNCTLTVRFSPLSIGAFSNSFDIPSDDPDENPVTVNVSGNGIGVPAPDITVTDTAGPANDLQVPFTDLTVGGSNDQTVTVVNDGNADLVIGNVAQANALAAPFSVINDTCSDQMLVATASCTLDVHFVPTAGTFNDSFDIPSNDPDEDPVTINVSGTGLEATGTAANNPPSSPNLVFPANGQQSLSTTLTLKWNPTTDPDGDTVNYDVYNCTDSDPLNNCSPVVTNVASLDKGLAQGVYYASLGLGGGVMILGITLTGAMRSRKQTALLVAALVMASLLSSCFDSSGSNNNSKTYTVSGLSSGSTYYWAVVAKDGNGGETPSAVWSYTTQ